MEITELINKLTEIYEEYGDCTVGTDSGSCPRLIAIPECAEEKIGVNEWKLTH